MNNEEKQELVTLVAKMFGVEEQQVKLVAEENANDERKMALKIAEDVLDKAGFEDALIIARDDDGFGGSVPKDPVMVAHLLLSALLEAPKGTLEHIITHVKDVFDQEGDDQCD